MFSRRSPNPLQDAGACANEIALLRFIDNTIFETKLGDLGILFPFPALIRSIRPFVSARLSASSPEAALCCVVSRRHLCSKANHQVTAGPYDAFAARLHLARSSRSLHQARLRFPSVLGAMQGRAKHYGALASFLPSFAYFHHPCTCLRGPSTRKDACNSCFPEGR